MNDKSGGADAKQAKADACSYILHMLLQRLEKNQPGLVIDMLDGAKADRAALQAQGMMPYPVEQAFDQAIALLEQVLAQNEMNAPPG